MQKRKNYSIFNRFTILTIYLLQERLVSGIRSNLSLVSAAVWYQHDQSVMPLKFYVIIICFS